MDSVEQRMLARHISRVIHAASMTAIWITIVQTALLASFAIGFKMHEECQAERECPDMLTALCVFPNFAIYGLAIWQYFKMEKAIAALEHNVIDQ